MSSTQDKNMTKPKRLICSCCNSSCIGRQWFNRDKGFGICKKCSMPNVQNTFGRPDSNEEIKQRFGIRGHHFDIPGANEDE